MIWWILSGDKTIFSGAANFGHMTKFLFKKHDADTNGKMAKKSKYRSP